VLHITNGDSAVRVLSRAVGGEFLPWRDVLHEGPVQAGIPLEDLSRRRAAFIAQAGWAPPEAVQEQFAARDRRLQDAMAHEEVVLWFEHDLYDQLQLIQVLDGLSELRGPPISLVGEAEYLGNMAPERAAELFSLRSPVMRRHFQEAQAAWAAFRSPDPRGIDPEKPKALPFLGAALRRHLEEFPWTTDGLSRTERQVLQVLADGPLPFPQLMRKTQSLEDPIFLGDAVLAWHLDRLESDGLVDRRGEAWARSGKERRQRLPRWLGGYEVRDDTFAWDAAIKRLVHRS
jgi:hypothetical protein